MPRVVALVTWPILGGVCALLSGDARAGSPERVAAAQLPAARVEARAATPASGGAGIELRDAAASAVAAIGPLAPRPEREPLDPLGGVEAGGATPGELAAVNIEAPALPAAAVEAGRGAVARDPFDRAFPLYGVAFHFLAQVFSAPNERGSVTGYLRRGATFRAKPGVRGKGCNGLWHAIFGGGYVCAGRGFSLGDVPQSFVAAAPPRLYEALPYRYAKAETRDRAVYFRLPTPDEEAAVAGAIAEARAAGRQPRTGTAAKSGTAEASSIRAAAPARAAGAARPPDRTFARGAAAKTPCGRADRAGTSSRGANLRGRSAAQPRALPCPARALPGRGPSAAVGGEPIAALPPVVRMLLQPGFYVSLDPSSDSNPLGAAADSDLRARAEPGAIAGAPAAERSGAFARWSAADGFLRTVRGDVLRSQGERFVEPPDEHGVLVPEHLDGELRLVAKDKATRFARDAISGELRPEGQLRLLEPLQLTEEVIVVRGRRYRVSLDGWVAAEDALRALPAIERPALVPRNARWIGVSLASQTLVAYEGERPVFATLVSTGKAGHETPTGIFRIQSKHVSTTMDGEAGSDEAYSIEDVPWVMYFAGSIALHAAFWHERFGRTRSHGCVNLAPWDARWLFEWTTPSLPSGFHGVLATTERAGTFVVVTP